MAAGKRSAYIRERNQLMQDTESVTATLTDAPDPGRAATLMRIATYAAVASAFTLVTVKSLAYFQTNSVALLSSLIDSALDLLASGVNLVAVRHALEPADSQHRFGHGKAESLSALAQAAFVAGSAILLAIEAVSRFTDPSHVTHGPTGIAVMVFSIVLTVALVTFQRQVVKTTGSIAITADFLHYTGDVLLNLSVIAALVLVTYFQIVWADAAFGLGIALFLFGNAIHIARKAVSDLMDRELPEEERRRIIDIARGHPKVKSVHELRTRTSGMNQFIQFHIVLDNKLSLLEAHRISDTVEDAIRAMFPTADVIIHQDPDGITEVHPPMGAAGKP